MPGSGKEGWKWTGQIDFTLPAKNRPVDVKIVHKHLNPPLERFRNNFALVHIPRAAERNAIGQAPGVTLPGHGSELIDNGQTLFM